jgi:hypothetical protein
MNGLLSNLERRIGFLLSDPEGIQVVDRCQLDPLGFETDEERAKRASQLLASIIPGRSKRRLRAGHVDDRLFRCRGSFRTGMHDFTRRAIRFRAFAGGDDKLKGLPRMQHESPTTVADHLARQTDVEVAVLQPGVNLGDDPAECTIARATA